jgi:hypothetical protein
LEVEAEVEAEEEDAYADAEAEEVYAGDEATLMRSYPTPASRTAASSRWARQCAASSVTTCAARACVAREALRVGCGGAVLELLGAVDELAIIY